MKVAVIGSRRLSVKKLGDYLPDGVTEIVSGGAGGIDADAEEFAIANGLKLTLFLPEYQKYRRNAPLVRNKQLIEYSDIVIAFWDGESRGTKHVIETCKKLGREIRVYKFEKSSDPIKAQYEKEADEEPLTFSEMALEAALLFDKEDE